jgi:MFS family permease
LPFFIAAHFAHHLMTALPVPLLPFIRSYFNLSYTQSAFVVTSFTLSNAVSQLPAGWLADRIGTRVLITVGILGVAVTGLLVGISHTYGLMLVFLILMGFAGGGYHPASAPTISSSVEPQQRGRALGLHQIGGNAAFFLTPVIAGAIAGANIFGWGWRVVFLTFAIPVAIFGIFFYYFMRQRPTMTRDGAATIRNISEAPLAPGHVRRIVSLLILTLLGSGFSLSMAAFLTLYMVDKFGATEQVAASVLSIFWSAGLWAGPVGGYISDRIGRVPVLVATGLISGICIWLVNLAPWVLWFIVVLLFIGISNTMRMPVAEAFILDQTKARNRSTIYGVYYFVMGGSGAVFAPIIGYVIDRWDFSVCFTAIGVLVVIVTLLCAPFLRGGSRSGFAA